MGNEGVHPHLRKRFWREMGINAEFVITAISIFITRTGM